MKIRRVYGLDVIVAQIHATQVREWRLSCRSQPTPGQTQVNQKVVVFQVTRLKPTVTSVQVAQLQVPRDGEGPSAGEGVPVAQAAIRAGEVTKTLIVELRTLRPAVTHVCHVQADGGATAAVETRTHVAVAALLVLAVWAVVHTVTADVHRKAVAVVCTPVITEN